MHRVVIAALCALVCWPARAQPVALEDQTLKSALAGKTVHLDTPFGVGIPITYHGNGLMSGRAGLLEYILGAETDRGRWWVADGKLCQKWFKWLDAQPSCMRLQRDGNKIFWRRDDGLSGTATIAAGLPPGADAAPQGLGGPVQRADLARAPNLAEQGKAVTVAMTSAAGVHHKVRAAPPRAVEVAHAPQPSDEDGGAGSATRARLSLLTGPVARAGEDDRWCQGDLAATPSSDAAPDLVKVARLAYAQSAALPPTNACLAAEPALQYLARRSVDMR
jgi:hypothetical protein